MNQGVKMLKLLKCSDAVMAKMANESFRSSPWMAFIHFLMVDVCFVCLDVLTFSRGIGTFSVCPARRH
jgi:hypothetical protein